MKIDMSNIPSYKRRPMFYSKILEYNLDFLFLRIALSYELYKLRTDWNKILDTF